MKTLKLLSIITLLLISTSFINKANAKEFPNPKNLQVQIYKELIDLFEKPIPLIYEDKNLKGESFVTIVVADNGKLFISDIYGKNNILNCYIRNMISKRNLWTGTDLAGAKFVFKIISK